jgi:hypothetical protein
VQEQIKNIARGYGEEGLVRVYAAQQPEKNNGKKVHGKNSGKSSDQEVPVAKITAPFNTHCQCVSREDKETDNAKFTEINNFIGYGRQGAQSTPAGVDKKYRKSGISSETGKE